MSLNLRDKTDVEAWAAFWMLAAKMDIERSGALLPVATIVVTRNIQEMQPGGFVLIKADAPLDADSKFRWVSKIKEIVQAGAALAVMTAGEAILAAADGPEAGLEQEVVVVDLEHATLGDHSWVANIIRGDTGVKLTPFKTRRLEARFGKFLKR
jgi:hypothetical protein